MKLLPKKYFSGLTTSSILLACASFFADISTEMLYPVFPIYLIQNLKASGSIVGIIEGPAEATQNIIQGVSGYFSDKSHRRKPIALFGYLLSAISKPFIAVANVWQGALAARLSDRLGAGTRSTPRDALIASSVEEKKRGKAFGLGDFGDNLGAFLGPLITVLLFFSLQLPIRYVFYFSIVPGLLAALMILFVKEKNSGAKIKSRIDLRVSKFPKAYWKYLIVITLFGIGNSSNSFLILQVKDRGLSLVNTVLVYAMFNFIAALISYPAGSLSDKFGRKPVLLISFIIFLISYIGFAFISDLFLIGSLFIYYGLFQGIFRAIQKSFATDFVLENLRAGGIGWYTATIGLTGLVASILAGQLWDRISHSSVFIYGALSSFIGIITLITFIPSKQNKKISTKNQSGMITNIIKYLNHGS